MFIFVFKRWWVLLWEALFVGWSVCLGLQNNSNVSRSSSLPVDSEVTDSALASVSRQAEVSAPTREPEKGGKNILPVSSKDEGQDIRISTVEEDMTLYLRP